ncbi:MAG: DNA polymerase III subunit gamma/tau [Proteobacteria bacterium]|nr:DNA polymerase III subunit gamma/tau [Pseudomonadota bacterium]
MFTYRVLARQYRPSKLSELIGQDVLVQTLSQGIQHNRLPHAFLLHGIRGVGKTTTARILAKTLNCLENQLDPCGQCPSCLAMAEDRHLDVIEMDAASRTSVEDIREIIDSVPYKAVLGRYKIYIIDEVHMLSKSAFNALLKTLEEPPAHVKFIFATTELKKVPDTVLSRCMRFDLNRVEGSLIINHLKRISDLENVKTEEEALALIARASEGSVRDALSLLDQAIILSNGQVSQTVVKDMLGLVDRGLLFDLLTFLLKADIQQALELTQKLYSLGADPVFLMEDLLDIIYFITCLKHSPSLKNDKNWPLSERERAQQLAQQLTIPILIRTWQVLVKGYEEIVKSPLQRQALEMVLVRLAYLSDLPLLHELLRKKDQEPLTSLNNDSQPQNFEEMLALLSKAKEPILVGNIFHHVIPLSFEYGKIQIGLTPQAPQTLVSQLQAILKKLTGRSWVIEVKPDQTQQTFAQKEKKLLEEKKKKSQNHPLVIELLETFKGATLRT